MALATWLIPLASVMSPGSLTAQLVEVTYSGNCVVKSVNFTLEAVSDWRSPRHGQIGFNIAFFNTTPPPPAKSVADWYDQPSQNTERITQLSIYTDQLVPEKSSPCPSFNCTYVTEVSQFGRLADSGPCELTFPPVRGALVQLQHSELGCIAVQSCRICPGVRAIGSAGTQLHLPSNNPKLGCDQTLQKATGSLQ